MASNKENQQLNKTGEVNIVELSPNVSSGLVQGDDNEDLNVPPQDLALAEEEKHKNCCQRCCSSIMHICVNDALYGSFVGPHPVSFFCCCFLCKNCCSTSFVRPFAVASIATKVMYLIMLGFVSLLSCFFIIPWPVTVFSHNSTSLASFFPCQHGKEPRNHKDNGGCEAHAGYFMVYRCFFAFGTIMLTNCLIMPCVQSTNSSTYRSKIHRGFWFYKYLYLGALMTLYFLFLDGQNDKEAVFEFSCSIIGNIAHLLFTIIEFTFVLDVIEVWVISNRSTGSKWASCQYWTAVFITTVLDILLLVCICTDFAMKQKFGKFSQDIKWPLDNCVKGERYEIDWLHLGLIIASIAVVLVLILVMALKFKDIQQRFPYTGWLQVTVIALFNFLYLWSALFSSPLDNITEQHKSDFLSNLQKGSWDIYFRSTGLFHGILAILALFYFVFVHGPRTETAPLSITYYYLLEDNARIPVFPDEDDSPKEYLTAIENHEVWDDEQEEVAYSWSFFYVIMMLSGFSLMMAMTNFTNPWAQDRYNSSLIAFGCKFGAATIAIFIYIMVLVLPNSKISPESDLYKIRRLRKNVINKGKDEAVGNDEMATSEVAVEAEESFSKENEEVPAPLV